MPLHLGHDIYTFAITILFRKEIMQDLWEALRRTLEEWDINRLPSVENVVASMDLVAWTLVVLLLVAMSIGVYFSFSNRPRFKRVDDVEAGPESVLARLKRDPTLLPPSAIIRRLGAEATLEFLEYGDQVDENDWRYRWSAIRNDLIHLLRQQNAFGPTYALARYYRSADKEEPDTLRIRRTALIHKLGLLRRLDANGDGVPTELRIRRHPAEVVGDLGFDGHATWLMPDEPAAPPQGPLIEMDTIDFRTLEEAEVNMNIRRTPMAGGGFRLHLEKRHHMWVVVGEDIEWAS